MDCKLPLSVLFQSIRLFVCDVCFHDSYLKTLRTIGDLEKINYKKAL